MLVELLQDACALLECRTPLDLCAALRPVQDLAALVPRLERFAGDVCAAVFQRGLAHVPKALRQDNPADVPAILSAWVAGAGGMTGTEDGGAATVPVWHSRLGLSRPVPAELGELVETRGMLRGVLRHLASRCSLTPADPPPVRSCAGGAWQLCAGRFGLCLDPALPPAPLPQTVGQVVPLVASLVELEREVWHSREVIRGEAVGNACLLCWRCSLLRCTGVRQEPCRHARLRAPPALAAAEGVLLAHPDVLVNRIVGQFQRLFGCRGLEGVLPAMNKLYLSHTGASVGGAAGACSAAWPCAHAASPAPSDCCLQRLCARRGPDVPGVSPRGAGAGRLGFSGGMRKPAGAGAGRQVCCSTGPGAQAQVKRGRV